MGIPSRSMMAFAAAALAMASAEENGYPWSEMSGDWFILNRNQVYVPDSPSIYYHCVGGAGSVETRLVISSPGVAYDEIDFDTSTWEDPLDDWNATLNENIGQTTGLGGISVAGGSGCSCTYFQLNFYEWLKSNEDAGSAIAFDFYQRPWPAPTPSNWLNTGYLDPGQDVPEIEEAYGGDVTLSFVNQGWYPPTKVSTQSSEPFTTTSKRLRIDDGGEPFVLRAMSETDYKLLVYLIDEDPDPIIPERSFLSEASGHSPRVYHFQDMFTSPTMDAAQATAFKFDAAPEGKYYAITIWNDGTGEDVLRFEGSPTFECGPGENGENTRNEVTFTFANGAGHSTLASAVVLLTGYLVLSIF